MLLPPFAKYLSKYGDWELSDLAASILIPSREYHFNDILIKPRRLSYSADKSWNFIASVIIWDKEHFSETFIPLWQRLKGYECELVRVGLIRRSFHFQAIPLTSYLQKEILELVIDSTLMEMLNQDDSLQHRISMIVPDGISIQLFSQPINTKDFAEYTREFRGRFDSPSDLIWNVSIEKFLGPILSRKKYNKTLDLIIESLEIMGKHVQRITKMAESRF